MLYFRAKAGMVAAVSIRNVILQAQQLLQSAEELCGVVLLSWFHLSWQHFDGRAVVVDGDNLRFIRGTPRKSATGFTSFW